MTEKPNKAAVLVEENVLAENDITDMVISQHTICVKNTYREKIIKKAGLYF